MLEFGNKEFRNLQEQVGKNKEDISTLKSGIKIEYEVAAITDLQPLLTQANVGKYVLVTGPSKLYLITKRANEGLIAINLGTFPEVVQGPKGDTGNTGASGERGKSIYGVGTNLPSPTAYEEGDFYLQANGNISKKVNGVWVLQCSLKGPQGIQGESGTSIYANPSQASTDQLSKIKIDGIVYAVSVITSDDRDLLDYFEDYTSHDNATGEFTFGNDVEIDGDLKVNSSITVDTPDDILFDHQTTQSLNDFLLIKEDKSNKVTSISSSSNNTQYPSAKCVYDNLKNVREVAEGKCKTYVISYTQAIPVSDAAAVLHYKADGTHFTSLADFQNYVDGFQNGNSSFNDNDEQIDIGPCYIITTDKYVYVDQVLEKGDVILVTQTNVPDRWAGSFGVFNALETQKVDISNMATTNTDQTISGLKVFSGGIIVGDNYGVYSTVQNKRLIAYNSNNGISVTDYSFCPQTTGLNNLGLSSNKWKDLYLSGKMYFGTSIIPEENISQDIGDSEHEIRNLYARFSYIRYSTNNFSPTTDNTKDLGYDNSHRWRTLRLGTSLQIGNTSLTEQQLIDLLALLNQ